MDVLFAKRLKELRQEKNMTQEKLGEYLGYGFSAIGNYERGRTEPSLEALMRLCEALDVSADYLIGLSDDRDKNGKRA